MGSVYVYIATHQIAAIFETVYTIREFRKNIKAALDEADTGKSVFLERNGVVYTITRKKENLCTPSIAVNQYGCGCERVDGQNICKKHQRY